MNFYENISIFLDPDYTHVPVVCCKSESISFTKQLIRYLIVLAGIYLKIFKMIIEIINTEHTDT